MKMTFETNNLNITLPADNDEENILNFVFTQHIAE